MHPTTSLQLIDCQEQLPSLIAPVERCLLPLAQSQSKRGPGKPVTIQWPHLWLGLLLSVLLGMKNYQQWCRRMCSQPIGPFAPLAVTDDALIKRLKQAGIDPLLALLQSIS